MVRILLIFLLFLSLTPNLSAFDLASIRKTHGDDLGIFIMGSIVNTVKDNNVALIKETGSGKVNAVKKGFRVLDKYRVLEVTQKYMILGPDRGEPLLVYLDKFSREFTNSRPPSSIDHAPPPMTVAYQMEGFERTDGHIRITSRLRERIVNEELSKILMDATAIPYYEGGEIRGFKLLQITKGSIYESAGFQDEDVITMINGIPLNNIGNAIKLLHSLKKENKVEVELKRNGQTVKTDITVS